MNGSLFCLEATEEVSLDSPEREPILSSDSTPAITPVTPTTLIAPRMESKTVVAPVDFDRCREEVLMKLIRQFSSWVHNL